MAYEDIYKGLTDDEKEKMIKADIPKFVDRGNRIDGRGRKRSA